MDPFADIMVIYPSVDDVEPDLWVAHSIRTDQVGVGHDPIEAVRELALAMRTLFDEASRNPAVRVEQPAPAEVVERLATARKLPDTVRERIRAAMRSCQQHDPHYWSANGGEDGWEDDPDTAYYSRIEQDDLNPV